MEDSQFVEKLAISINNKCTYILENISMYFPSTLCLATNCNQQNILDGITPVLPSISTANFNAPNHQSGNFNSNNSNRSGIGLVRVDTREVKEKQIICRPRYYIKQPDVLKYPKELFHKVIYPGVQNPAFERHNNSHKVKVLMYNVDVC